MHFFLSHPVVHSLFKYPTVYSWVTYSCELLAVSFRQSANVTLPNGVTATLYKLVSFGVD